VWNDGGAIPRPPFSSAIRLMKFGYCCLERASQIICRERSIWVKGTSRNPGCHWEGLNFLHSPHCKLSSTRQQYCLVLAGEQWFPYFSGAQDVRFCEDMVLSRRSNPLLLTFGAAKDVRMNRGTIAQSAARKFKQLWSARRA
jgi:hypothetical protein